MEFFSCEISLDLHFPFLHAIAKEVNVNDYCFSSKMLKPSFLDDVITLYSDSEEDVKVLDTSHEAEEYYAIRMNNIPDTCSEKSILEFFAADDNGEPVSVFLDEDGVLIIRSGIRSSQAFVVFKGKDMAKKALLKNFQPIGTSLVHITDDSVLDTMFKELSVSPRTNLQIKDEDSRRVVLNKLPHQVDKNDLKNFFEPYYIWVSTFGRHYTCRLPQQPDYCDLTITMVSKLTALFFVMKRNGTNIKLDGKVFPMSVKMYAYFFQTEDDDSFVHDHRQCWGLIQSLDDVCPSTTLANSDDDSLSSEWAVVIKSDCSQPEIYSDVSLAAAEPCEQPMEDEKKDERDSPETATKSWQPPNDFSDTWLPANELSDHSMQGSETDLKDYGNVTHRYQDSVFLICVANLPVACTAKQVVDFFASDGPGGPVEVCLGTAGVVLQTVYSSTSAYVLLNSWDDHCRAMKKNFGRLEDRFICIENCSLWKAMHVGCAMRSRPMVIPESRQSILVSNLPPDTTLEDMLSFFHPYDIWIIPDSPNFIAASPYNENEELGLFQFRSELAAFFVFMNKNHTPIEVKGCRRLVRVTMQSAYSPNDMEYQVPTLQNPSKKLTRPIKVKNVKRELPTGQNSWATVRLQNLPADITEEDIQALFIEKVLVPVSNIALHRVTEFSTNAGVVFPSIEEGIRALDNIRSFEIEEHVVTVRICAYSEE